MNRPFLYPYLNTAGLVHNMAGGDARAKQLLNGLTNKELHILSKNQDLLERIVAITRVSALGLYKVISDRFGFVITTVGQGYGDFWADLNNETDNNLPEEFVEWYRKTEHTGWYLSTVDAFGAWAQDLLMQEIRTNLMLRYIEHKRAQKKSRMGAASRAVADIAAGYGLYL